MDPGSWLVFVVICVTAMLTCVAIIIYALNRVPDPHKVIDMWFKLSGALFFTLSLIISILNGVITVFLTWGSDESFRTILHQIQNVLTSIRGG